MAGFWVHFTCQQMTFYPGWSAKLWEPYFINLYLSLLICYSCSHSPCTCHNSFKVCPSVCLDSYNIGPVAHTLFSAKISFLHSEMCHPFYCIDVKFVGPRFSLDFMMCIHPTFTPPLSQLVRFFRLPQLCAIPHNAAVSVLGHIPLPVWEVSSSGFPGAVCMGHRVSVLYLMMNYQVLDGMAALGFFFTWPTMFVYIYGVQCDNLIYVYNVERSNQGKHRIHVLKHLWFPQVGKPQSLLVLFWSI
jgi:hypothetical protein